MKAILKKGLAWVLSLCMMMTILPTTALAVDTYDGITVNGGTEGVDYSWDSSSKTLSILTNTQLTLSGTASSLQVLVAGIVEANLTLNGLNITNNGENDDSPIKLSDTAKLNLTLAEGSVSTLDTHYSEKSYEGKEIYYGRADAIHVAQGTALTISGTGTLNAYSGRNYTAIGNSSNATGDIVIQNGIVNAFAYGTLNYPGGIGIGGETRYESTSGGGNITINGGTVTAYGDEVGIGYKDFSTKKTNYNINITGGTVKAYGMPYSDGINPDEVSDAYLSSVGIGGDAEGVPGERNILISGGKVTAYGSRIGIGGSFDSQNTGESIDALNIKMTGGEIIAYSFAYRNGIGLGGNMKSTDHRNIEISGTAKVNAKTEYGSKSVVGGGDNSKSTIIIKGNAEVNGATTIGSTGRDDNTKIGFAGGTIQIIENASIGVSNYYESAEHIGGSDVEYLKTGYCATGGAGGDITIDTTGTIYVESIGGGNGYNGGDGGNIIIKKGTIGVEHIGGGDGNDDDGTGVGGNGGNITISGGVIEGKYSGSPSGSTGKKENSYYYASAAIGGGGGTLKGGNGGNITISGGEVNAEPGLTVYNPATGELVEEGGSGTGIGGAGIGGGNGASGGVINITGGTVNVKYVSRSPDKPASATASAAFIGGGSTGGSGEITISGGSVYAWVHPYNVPAYGSDSTTIGQGKGATDAGGFVKITGGSVSAYPDGPDVNTYGKPTPWPTAADGSSKLYRASLSFYDAVNLPEGLNLYDSRLVSMTIKEKSSGSVYSYGIRDIDSSFDFWLPIKEDISTWTDREYRELYDVTLSVKKDNTVYGFTGVIRFCYNENHVGNIAGDFDLTYTGEVIETLQLTSDWGSITKTYNGLDQKPSFTVKNTNGISLNEGTDYALEIEYYPNGNISTPMTVTNMKNVGGYKVTAIGKAGTAYDGMTAVEEYHINPKYITAVYSGDVFTKQYDGTTDVFDGKVRVESVALTVNSSDLCTGDILTNVVAINPRYKTAGVGNDIEIDTNGATYTYTQNGTESSTYNYLVEMPSNLKGNITVKVIGETNLDTSDVTVTKVYDGTTNCTMSNVTGKVKLVDIAQGEIATVNITGVSAFDGKNAGNHTVTLNVGDLSGANAENYTLAGGVSAVDVSAEITRADYAFNLTEAQQAQEFTQRGGIAQISLPQTANGINSETVTGSVSLWHDEACSAQQATNDSVNALTVGEHTLYVKFIPDESETNYVNKVTTGKVLVLSVVEGEPQEVYFVKADTVSKIYGDGEFINLAENNSIDGGEISYRSSNSNVAVVDTATGEVTIKGVGTVTITATAAKVEGKYRETSATYVLTVAKKEVTVKAQDATRKFGETNPEFTIIIPRDILVGDDEQSDLGVSLTTTATKSSNVGTYSITGTSDSVNYDVTVTKGTLTVYKADAPIVSDIIKSLLYSEGHDNVSVIITGLPSDRGTTSFDDYTVNGDTEIIKDGVVYTVDGIRFSTNAGSENQTVTISLNAVMQNYEDANVNVIVKLVNKIPVIISSITAPNKIYDGKAYACVGTPSNDNGYSGAYDYVWSSGSAPKNVGNYTLTVKIPEDNAEYMGELVLSFEITPKKLTVKPKDISIYNGSSLPESFELEFVGAVTGDTISVNGKPSYQLQTKDGAALSDSKSNGSYVIKWINADKITLDNANYTFEKTDGVLTIKSKSSGGGSSSGGGTVVSPSKPDISSGNGKSTAKVDATVKTSGKTVKASVSTDSLNDAIKEAVKTAEEKKTKAAIEIKADAPKGTTEIMFSVPKTALKTFADSKAETLSLVSGIGEMTISADAAASIASQAGSSDIAVAIEKLDTQKSLSQKQKEAVGNSPVYDISISSGDKRISSFDGNTLTVTLPYTLKEGEKADGVVVWYVDDLGNIQKVVSSYDESKKAVVFTTNHLSLYAVGYEKTVLWNNPFADVRSDAWYYSAVQFVEQKGIMSGTSSNAFSPNMTTTRGMIATILYRLEGSPTADGIKFSDVSSGEWYTDAVAWATKSGVASGYGNGKFGPSNSISREQLAVMLMNYAKHKGYDVTKSSDSLTSFNDTSKISPWAIDAMNWAVSKGLITGTADGKLDSQGSATRSQVAVILMRFSEVLAK